MGEGGCGVRLAYSQYASIKYAEVTGQITGVVFQNPPHDMYFHLSACTGHPQQKHTRVGVSRMIYEFAKVSIHGDNNAVLTHSPEQDFNIAHAGVSVANEDRVVACLTQIVGHCATDVEIHQKAHLTETYAG